MTADETPETPQPTTAAVTCDGCGGGPPDAGTPPTDPHHLCCDGTECNGCSNAPDDAGGLTDIGGDLYCDGCHAECDFCDEATPNDDLATVSVSRDGCRVRERSVCRDCQDEFLQCGQYHCRNFIPDGEGYTYDGEQLCSPCYQDSFFTCEGCGEVCHDDDSRCSDDNFYCSACVPDEDDGDGDGEVTDGRGRTVEEIADLGVITSYAVKPKWTPRRTASCRPNDRLLGVELECEAPNGSHDVPLVLDAMGGFAICSRDGSLASNGFEIRTDPATLAYHRDAWKAFFAEGRPRGMKSHDGDGCGLHVHVGRKGVSQLATAKIVTVLHSFGWGAVRLAVARREGCSYAKTNPDKADFKARNRRPTADRYEIVNVTDRTIEFRLFRGTLKEDSFFACLEFADAVVAYAVSSPGFNAVATPDDFFKWLEKRSYPALKRKLAPLCPALAKKPKPPAMAAAEV